LTAVEVVLPSRGLQEIPKILTGLRFPPIAVVDEIETAAPAANVLLINFLRFIFVSSKFYFALIIKITSLELLL
jgi:hypothetical protein